MAKTRRKRPAGGKSRAKSRGLGAQKQPDKRKVTATALVAGGAGAAVAVFGAYRAAVHHEYGALYLGALGLFLLVMVVVVSRR